MRAQISMLLAAAALAAAVSPLSAQAETVIRYGISMVDIPLDQGPAGPRRRRVSILPYTQPQQQRT